MLLSREPAQDERFLDTDRMTAPCFAIALVAVMYFSSASKNRNVALATLGLADIFPALFRPVLVSMVASFSNNHPGFPNRRQYPVRLLRRADGIIVRND